MTLFLDLTGLEIRDDFMYVVPSNEYLQQFMTDQEIDVDLLNVIIEEFDLIAQHSFPLTDMKLDEIRSFANVVYDYTPDNWINDPAYPITNLDDNVYTVDAILLRDDDQLPRIMERIAELKELRRRFPVDQVPIDVLIYTMDYLSFKDIVALCSLNRATTQICNNPRLQSYFAGRIRLEYPRGAKHIVPGREYEYLRLIAFNPAERFFEQHLHLVDWTELCRNPSLSEAFFREHIALVNWYYLSQNPGLSEAFFREHIALVDWNWLSGNPALSEAFFRKHLDQVDWYWLSDNPGLSEAFFREHLHLVDWITLSRNPSLSETFFREHIVHVDWLGLSYNTSLSEAFFREYLRWACWSSLSANPMTIKLR